MNEAYRCDRVALMSMGRVLACESPEELVRLRGCSSLEEAFIAYMKDDIARNTTIEEDDETQSIQFMLAPERVASMAASSISTGWLPWPGGRPSNCSATLSGS